METKELVKFENEKQMMAAGKDYFDRIDAIKITSREKFQQMVAEVDEAKSFIRSITEFFKPMKQKTHEAHKAVCDQENEALKYFRQGERIGKQRILGWQQIEAERQRKAEAKQREAIKSAEQNGTPAPVFRPPENKAKTLAPGVSKVEKWVGEVLDFDALLKAILKAQAPNNFIKINHEAINAFAQGSKGKVKVPGVEFKRADVVRFGGKR